MFHKVVRNLYAIKCSYRALNYSFTSCANPNKASLLDQVEGKIFQILKQNSKCKTHLITKTSKFSELGIDSLQSVELVINMQNTFGIDLENEEAIQILSVDKAINIFFTHINSRIANKMVQTSKKIQTQINS